MTRDRAVAALLLLALLVVGYLGARPAATGTTRASADATAGGYRAWYELEEREGLRTARFRRHHDALGSERIDTLIVAFPGAGVPARWDRGEDRALDAWVERGGYAVAVGPAPSTGAAPKAGDVTAHIAHGVPGALRGPWSAYVHDLRERGTLRIVAPRSVHPATLLADGAGALVVRYRQGRGTYLAVASAAPFENHVLGTGDNARLAFLLAQPRRSGGVVAFDEAVRGDIVEGPWYRALDAAEKLALAIAAFAGLLWLLGGLVRLGPPVRLRAPREPTSAEFVDAYAALYARARSRDHARDALVADARRALERAPRTAENGALAARAEAAAHTPVGDDAALVAVARLARTIREDTIREHDVIRHRAAASGGFGAGRRRR